MDSVLIIEFMNGQKGAANFKARGRDDALSKAQDIALEFTRRGMDYFGFRVYHNRSLGFLNWVTYSKARGIGGMLINPTKEQLQIINL